MNLGIKTIKLNSLVFTTVLGLVLLVTACTPKAEKAAQNELGDLPGWFINPPEDNENFLYATASAESRNLQTARQKAEVAAKTALSQKLGEKVEALQKLFSEEITAGDESNYNEAFTSASQTITSQELKGASIDEFAPKAQEDGRFMAYVLLRMPVGDARAALENALSKEEELYVRFKESKAFEELQNNLDRLGQD